MVVLAPPYEQNLSVHDLSTNHKKYFLKDVFNIFM